MNYIIDWYLWYFPLLVIFAFIQNQQRVKYLANASESKKEDDFRVPLIFSIIVFLPIILITGNRSELIGDTWAYIQAYKGLPSSVSEFLNTVDWGGRDPGFYFFSTIIKSIFGEDYRIWLGVIASISGICIAVAFRKFSNDVVTCAFLFFASADYMSWMMNGMRQFLVVAILFALFPILLKRKASSIIFYFLIVLALSSVHRSCLIVIPLYLCSMGKPFNKRTIVFMSICFLAVAFAGQFTNILDESLQGTVFSNTVSQFDDDGTNFFRVLVYSVPAVLAVIFRKRISEDTPEIIKVSVNMSLITSGIYLISMVTSGIYIGRVPIYFSLFNYVLLPWEINHFFFEGSKKIVRGLMIFFYLIFYYISMVGIN